MIPMMHVRGSVPEIVRNDGGLYEGNLIHYFQVLFFEAENQRNPYHNLRHICHVLWLCYQARIFYHGSGFITPRGWRNIFIAALFHDFNHTGVAGPDDVNIERAVTALKEHILPEDQHEVENIADLIRVTRYPYEVPSEELDLPAQILRDADLSQAFSVAWIQQVVFGLSAEWDEEPIEVLKMQDSFLQNLEFSTAWIQLMFPPETIEEKIAEARELVELLTSEPAVSSVA